MKNFVICITDASQVDRQIVVSVPEPTNLGRAAHLALDQVMDEGAKLQFPVFLDIHSADEFNSVAWMHGPHGDVQPSLVADQGKGGEIIFTRFPV